MVFFKNFSLIRRVKIEMLLLLFLVCIMGYLNDISIVGLGVLMSILYIIQLVQNRIIVNKKICYLLKICLCSLISVYMIEIGNCNQLSNFNFSYVILNGLYVLTFITILYIFFSLRRAMYMANILLFILSVIAYYVYHFRGIPLTYSNIAAISAAATVIAGYRFEISIQLVICLLLFVFICLNIKEFDNEKIKRSKKVEISLITVLTVILINGLRLESLEVNVNNWSLQSVYNQYGFIACTVTDITSKKIIKPEEYNEELINCYADRIVAGQAEYSEKPDIIFVVNESFYNIKALADFKVNQEVMPFYNSLTNTIRGYAVNPNTTTANSEYELLTSQTMFLTPSVNPFLHIDLTDSNSLIKNVKEQGYYTSAYHASVGSTYNRAIAYDALGFDGIHFDNFNGNEMETVRGWQSDRECYKQLIGIYEEGLLKNKPQFVYCLTIQNHGGYDNGGIETPIEIVDGEIQDSAEIREYMALMNQSDEAFKELINYFEEVDRPTIVLMVGDHAPVFASQYVDSSKYEDSREGIMRIQGTPLIIWANYDIEDADVGYVGMNYVANIITNLSGNELSDFNKNIEYIHQYCPVFTKDFYMDSDGNYHDYFEDNEYKEMVDSYLFGTYYNLVEKSDIN